MKRSLMFVVFFSCALAAIGGSAAFAQNFPTKPIRIVLPFPPGGPTDLYARIVAQGLKEKLGQQSIVDNRPGASGTIGTEMVAKAAPDGYTLLFMSTHHAINPYLYKNLPYNTEKDFTPIILVAINPSVLVAHPSLPANTIKELIALAKSKPGQLNYASNSIGGGAHLSTELLKSMAGINIMHIPYKGAAPAMNDLLAGHVPLMMTSVGPAVPHIKAGKLKALGVTSAKRLSNLPDVPTIGETVPGYEANSWFAMWGPGNMPKEIVSTLNKAIASLLHSPEVQKRFASLDAEPGGNSPEEFRAFQEAEMAKWSKVIKEIGLQLEAN